MGICCMAQETQKGALYQPGRAWGGGMRREMKGKFKWRGYMYTYG